MIISWNKIFIILYLIFIQIESINNLSLVICFFFPVGLLSTLKVACGLPFNLQVYCIVSGSGLPCWQVPSGRVVWGIVTDTGLIGQAAARYRRNMHIFLTLCQGQRNSSQSCIDGGRDTDTKIDRYTFTGSPR